MKLIGKTDLENNLEVLLLLELFNSFSTTDFYSYTKLKLTLFATLFQGKTVIIYYRSTLYSIEF
jgi:hypothetical protein